MTFLLLGALLLSVPCAARAGDSLDENRRTLEQIEKRIRDTARNLQQQKQAERSLAKDIKAVENAMVRLRARVKKQQVRVADLNKQIAASETAESEARAEVHGMEGMVRKRLAALYRQGPGGPLRILLGSESPARMAEDLNYTGRIVRRDRELMRDFRGRIETLQATQQRLGALRDDRQKSLATLEEEKQVLERAARLKKRLYAQAHTKKVSLSNRLSDLKGQAERLVKLIKKLESAPSREYTSGSGPFAEQRGKLPWPVAGAVRVGFGTWKHPDLGTVYDSQGYEFAAADNVKIAAIWPGRVAFANWFKGYGNLIILDHGDGYYTLYSQVKRLAHRPGDIVRQGESLGVAGGKGVYFEIRHGGTAVDPGSWLHKR